MSKTERRIIRIAIVLVFLSFFLNAYTNRIIAEAEPSTAIRSHTFRWEEKQAERDTWKLLRTELTETATAAVMGNMEQESGICPFRYEGLTYEESWNLNQIYRDNENKFVYSDRSYGLCSWHGTHNLQKLWDYCHEEGYEVDSVEGQVKFLLHDLKTGEPKCYARLNLYKLEQMMFAVEDFRQTYEKSVCSDYAQYTRGKAARQIYAGFCEDIYTIETVAQLPYNFDIYNIVKEMNKELENVDQTDRSALYVL